MRCVREEIPLRWTEIPFLVGGDDVGVVEVQAAVGISCESLTATLKKPVPVLNPQKALAASSIEGFNIHPNWRQQNTPSQRAACIEAASGLPGEARSEDYVDEVEENFVDQIDLDASGKEEIITISYDYESWDYAIYKSRNGTRERSAPGAVAAAKHPPLARRFFP